METETLKIYVQRDTRKFSFPKIEKYIAASANTEKRANTVQTPSEPKWFLFERCLPLTDRHKTFSIGALSFLVRSQIRKFSTTPGLKAEPASPLPLYSIQYPELSPFTAIQMEFKQNF